MKTDGALCSSTSNYRSEGDWRVRILADGWTAVTVDGARTAQMEHTVLITDTGAEILTQ